MKLLSINESNYGSTGRIMLSIAKFCQCDNIVAVSNSRSNKKENIDNCIYIGSRIGRNIHLLLYKYTGLNGCFSIIDTFIFLKKIKKYDPDIIHIHNLHNCFINLPLLFNFLKKNKYRVIWTLHDCWSFTGHCPHFINTKCYKWKNGCEHCISYKEYPMSQRDSSKKMWNLKKKWFSGVENLTIVTPSTWLRDNLKSSFLNEYKAYTIYNGVDISVFRKNDSNFRERKQIESSKIVLLGVAYTWNDKKGLDVFCELANRLSEEYKIVLVGTNDEIDKMLPKAIISIHKTENRRELSEIYSAADLFINPTREDTFPSVNMEAICCGTKVITFDVGGCKETINSNVGECVPVDRIDLLICAIERWKNKDVPLNYFEQYRNSHDIKVCLNKYKELIYEKKK